MNILEKFFYNKFYFTRLKARFGSGRKFSSGFRPHFLQHGLPIGRSPTLIPALVLMASVFFSTSW